MFNVIVLGIVIYVVWLFYRFISWLIGKRTGATGEDLEYLQQHINDPEFKPAPDFWDPVELPNTSLDIAAQPINDD